MPAARRRGERWQDTLAQICERGGSIEITVDRRGGEDFRTDPGDDVRLPPPDLLWRVRVRETNDQRIVVDVPSALGRSIQINVGTRLVVVMSVGQNRWIFLSKVTGATSGPGGSLTLAVPERVERATRRAQQRVSTAQINLPAVRCWHLANPTTAVAAQAACRERIAALLEQPPAARDIGAAGDLDSLSDMAPDVGPGFKAELSNIGGGGVGLKIKSEDSALVESTRLYWTKLDLRPVIPAPLALIARLAHTHLDSQQNIYAGLAFEFGLDPNHRPFVADQIERYMRHVAG
ncbi:MAG: hypothetical protein H6810_08340 [Phycisphaeraceae bacterium]|nr:MAG: hypothetical protein H6810_08340 [Phycisphaeraceae bacterium]